VASIIAGTGAASGGKYKGVAPDAKLLDGKVCESEVCDESAILAGMQWAAADEHAKVVNVSIGGGDTAEVDPLEAAVNQLTAQYGSLFVIAAGNDGPSDTSIESPGSADAAITVGAVDSTDQLADFSSRGPRVGDAAIKPDITAPGVDIIAARAAGTQLGDPVGDSYVKLSGTSMATPHVTGAVALLAQEHPDWTAEQFKATLMAAAQPNPGLTVYQQGAGRVDVGRAVDQTVTAQPGGVSMGVQQWPHTDDQPVTRTVTYRNNGSTDVTLQLSTAVHAQDGSQAPAGMFTISAGQLTVPANGQAQVTLTADTRIASPDGLYSGYLTATAARTQVTTPIGIEKEVESYNLTITTLDRTGAPASDADTMLQGTDAATRSVFEFPYDPSGTVTLRLPKGGYDVNTTIDTPATNRQAAESSLLAEPALNLTSDTHITFDARTARPVAMTVPNTTVGPILAIIGYDHIAPWGANVGAGLYSTSFDGMSTAQQGASLPPTQLRGNIAAQWATAGADGTITGGPLYSVAEFPTSGLPTGFVKHYTTQDLAEVHARFGLTQPGDKAALSLLAVGGLSGSPASAAMPIALPSSLTEYVNTANWSSELLVYSVPPDGPPTIESAFEQVVPYRAGGHYQEVWNNAPFGPAFPQTPSNQGFINRQGDTLNVFPPMFGDAAGHAWASQIDSGSTTLYRDGVQIGQNQTLGGAFDVAADPARYRVEVQATRTGFGGLSSTVRAAWTFRSGHVDGSDPASLPATAVRFSPKLDANDKAPAGPFTIPVTVGRQPGSGSASVAQIHLSVSYDDGTTWQPVTLHRNGDGWTGTVTHPAGGGFVSLRTDATDSAGGTVEETIIHAYGLNG
jgi:hypothetical protein